jgi:uncharacterized protein (UPF0548 family)
MWSRARPDRDRVERYLAEQRLLAPTYDAIGGTQGDVPDGFTLDHNRREIGRGGDAFARACDAIRAWRMFPVWTAIDPADAPIATGTTIAVLVHALGVWWLNAARIVYLIDDRRRFGFAYGTLPGHAECGEERFSVEHRADDTVWYDLRAFSRPRFWAARLGYPITRALQRRFARDSLAAMERELAVRG